MRQKIKYIDLVYENCDSHRLKPDMFHSLIVDGITNEYWINCFQYEGGEVCEYIKCKSFQIDINKKGMDSICYASKETLEKRLKSWSDITHIDIIFADKTNKYITVPWGGEADINAKQKIKFKKDKIEIRIS